MDQSEIVIGMMLLRNKPNYSYVVVKKENDDVEMMVHIPTGE